MEPQFDSVRMTYDEVAVDYAELLADELATAPMDRAMLGAFAELVAGNGDRPIADIGCGPGRIAAHLDMLGATVFGVDLSPGMVAVARQRHPHLRFETGSMTALDLADEHLGGIVAWYSTVHIPQEDLRAVFAEFHRVLAPGGLLLIAFKVGDERVHLEHAYGHTVSLDVYRHSPDAVARLAEQAGLVEVSRLVRQPGPDEKTPQAFWIARKGAGAS